MESTRIRTTLSEISNISTASDYNCVISFSKNKKLNEKLNSKYLSVIFNKTCQQEHLLIKYTLDR